MRFLRVLLIASVLLLLFTAVVATARLPILAFALVAVALWRFRKRRAWTTHGSSEWATLPDVKSMFGGDGAPAGMMFDRPTKWQGFKALFNPLVPSSDAVGWFLSSWGV